MKYYHLHNFSSLWWNIFTLIEIYHVMSIWSKIYLNDENKIHHVKSIWWKKSTILIKFHTKNKTVNLNELSLPWWNILFWLELIMVLGYSKKWKFWIWTLVTQGIFVMTLLDNLSQKFAQKKHIFPSLIAKSFYKGIRSKIQRKNCFFSFLDFFPNFLSGEWF